LLPSFISPRCINFVQPTRARLRGNHEALPLLNTGHAIRVGAVQRLLARMPKEARECVLWNFACKVTGKPYFTEAILQRIHIVSDTGVSANPSARRVAATAKGYHHFNH
jgi:hypothetical protein